MAATEERKPKINLHWTFLPKKGPCTTASNEIAPGSEREVDDVLMLVTAAGGWRSHGNARLHRAVQESRRGWQPWGAGGGGGDESSPERTAGTQRSFKACQRAGRGRGRAAGSGAAAAAGAAQPMRAPSATRRGGGGPGARVLQEPPPGRHRACAGGRAARRAEPAPSGSEGGPGHSGAPHGRARQDRRDPSPLLPQPAHGRSGPRTAELPRSGTERVK